MASAIATIKVETDRIHTIIPSAVHPNEPSEQRAEVTVAVGQIGVLLGSPATNVATCRASLAEATSKGASLLVLPECALTGYLFRNERDARQAALRIDSPEIELLVKDCHEHDIYCVVGLLEIEKGSLFNTAALIGPEGVVGVYHKAHLPILGADRFVEAGKMAEPPVFPVSFGLIGLAICYDLRFPEWLRSMALSGADMVALPTNWPASQPQIMAEAFPRVRACENRIFILAADRWDAENGSPFLGHSQIVDPDGVVLAEQASGAGLLVQTVDLARARDKHIVIERGAYELALFDSRRPDLYGRVVQ